VDVFLLGPAMMYVGWSGQIPEWMRTLAVAGGAATISFNLANYFRVRNMEK